MFFPATGAGAVPGAAERLPRGSPIQAGSDRSWVGEIHVAPPFRNPEKCLDFPNVNTKKHHGFSTIPSSGAVSDFVHPYGWEALELDVGLLNMGHVLCVFFLELLDPFPKEPKVVFDLFVWRGPPNGQGQRPRKPTLAPSLGIGPIQDPLEAAREDSTPAIRKPLGPPVPFLTLFWEGSPEIDYRKEKHGTLIWRTQLSWWFGWFSTTN